MNAADVLMYGNRTVLRSIDGLPDGEWEVPGACGVWSVKGVIAHLTAFEWVLGDVLEELLGGAPKARRIDYTERHDEFNMAQVAERSGKTPGEQIEEYKQAHERVRGLIGRIPDDLRRRTGTLPWYGMQYSLEDYIVYASYGHKREHTAQIGVFRDKRKV